jgi:hypothetical protein
MPTSLLSLLVMLTVAVPAAAVGNDVARCSCFFNPMEPRAASLTARHHTQAHIVVLATVVDSMLPTAATPELYRLRAERWWKGEEGDTLLVLRGQIPSFQPPDLPIGSLSSCDYPFRVGESYVLFLRRGSDGWLRTDMCSGTLPRTSPLAEGVMAQLDAATEPAPDARLGAGVSRCTGPVEP